MRILYLLVGLFFIASYFFEISLISPIDTMSRINATSPDEALFFDTLRVYESYFRTGSKDPFPEGLPSGYGLTFWMLLVVLKKMGLSIVGIRIFFLTLKYLAVLLTAKGIQTFKFLPERNDFVGVFFILTFLLTPGFWFYGKIISPEYLIIFMLGASIFYLMKDSGRIGMNYSIAVLWSFLAAYTKINLVFYPVILALTGLIIRWLPKFYGKRSKLLGFCPSPTNFNFEYALVFLLFILFSLIWLSGGAGPIISDLLSINGISPDFKLTWERLLTAFDFYYITWDQIEVTGLKGFMPILLTQALGVFGFVRSRDKITNVPGGLVFFILCSFVLVFSGYLQLFMLITKSMAYSWYLFGPCFLILTSSSILVKANRLPLKVLIFTIISFAIIGFPNILDRVRFKLNVNKIVTINSLLPEDLNDFLIKSCPDARTVNSDILLPMESSQYQVVPARIALMEVIEKRWRAPDILLVNRILPGMGSPLLKVIVKEKISLFKEIKTIDSFPRVFFNNLVCKQK